MGKQYNSHWNAEKLIINFNQKQWRQDFAAFVREKLYWGGTIVTRSRVVSDKTLEKGIKKFEVYNGFGGNVQVVYDSDNKVISTSNDALIKQYFEERRVHYEK